LTEKLMTAATVATTPTKQTNARRQSPLAGAAPFLILFAFYAVCVCIVSPMGNFPLNDDWIYSEAVRTFLQSKHFVLYGDCCAACPVHILIGSAVSALFGFSYEALRFTSLTFGFAGVVSLYLILRELNISKMAALLSTLLFACNPIAINLLFSYMTDGSSAALVAIYMYAFVRGIRRNSTTAIACAGVALTAAVAVRQTNAAFVAANVVVLLSLWFRRKHSWAIVLWLIAMPLAAFAIADHMLLAAKTDTGYDWYKRSSTGIAGKIAAKPWKSAGKIDVLLGAGACYLGLFLAPLFFAVPRRLIGTLVSHARPIAVGLAVAVAIVGTALLQLIGRDHMLMPFCLNLLRVPSLGPLPLMGINFYGLHKNAAVAFTSISAVLAVVFVILTTVAISKVVAVIWRYVCDSLEDQTSTMSVPDDRRFRRITALAFCFACTAISLSIVGLQEWMGAMDRYYLIALAPCIVAVAMTLRWLKAKPLLWAQIPLLLLLAGYTIAAQKDYMEWNRVRWSGLRSLEARGIKPDDIDGGAEYFFLHHLTCTNERPDKRGAMPRRLWRWWPVAGEKYIVSFSPVPDYDLIETWHYWSALSFSKRNIYVLKAHNSD
jgi:hypothetical protein